jgi:hypothetical protein
MNLTLTRLQFREDGIFSRLDQEGGAPFCVTLEHSFGLKPKIPAGSYACVRGTHSLPDAVHFHGLFETFEITEVPGHTGLLFHPGNFQSDSEGCVLLGEEIVAGRTGQMITNSDATFERFMALQEGVQTFQLTVV